jgi:hypothetical protein
VTPRGQLLTLTANQRYVPEFDERHQIVDNELCLLDLEGRKLGALSLYDLVTDPGSPVELLRPKPNRDPRFPVIDLFHANSVDWVAPGSLAGGHPLYSPSVVLVCVRHQDALIAVDWDAERVVWTWGRGELSAPHDARLLENGNVLVFDNGLARGWSRVVELFSSGQGSSQRLANGNTLIANSLSGHAFEVTPEGEHVWDYLVPFFDEREHRATMYRIRRYEPERVEALLQK